MWQDVVLMIANFVFAPALVVSIIKRARYPVWTSLPTALALTAILISFLTLGLYLATFATTLTTVCWYILFFRRNG